MSTDEIVADLLMFLSGPFYPAAEMSDEELTT